MGFTKARTPTHFAQSPRSQRRISLDLTDEVFDPLVEYGVQTNPEGSFCDTLRELLLAAVAGDVQSSVCQSARRQEQNKAARVVRDAMSEALQNVATRLSMNGFENESVEPVNGELTEA